MATWRLTSGGAVEAVSRRNQSITIDDGPRLVIRAPVEERPKRCVPCGVGH
mgnify:CR=1 FL=1